MQRNLEVAIMDAREYLARKGIDLDKDEDRPNTLEELAWARARKAGRERPKSGTPHDWEDWDRYHAELAEGAESLQQKIDPAAHLIYQGTPENVGPASGEPSLAPPQGPGQGTRHTDDA